MIYDFKFMISNFQIYELGFTAGEGEGEGTTFGWAADGLDRTELTLVLTDVVLQREEDFLRLVGCYDDTRNDVRLGHTGHELGKVQDELGGCMRYEREVGKHSLCFLGGDVDL